MQCILWLSPIVCVAALSAADPAWRGKDVAQWRPDDAREVLTDSPWAKPAVMTVLPQRGEGQLRDGGKMGPARSFDVKNGLDHPRVRIRWESAPPVRAAEMIAGESGAPDWDGAYYAIAIYDIPAIAAGDYKRAGGELKQTALLKSAGMKDLKPERVVIDELENGRSRVLYLFPRSAEIRSTGVEFIAQIGRLYLAQFFLPEQMSFQGKLEL
jgi:hypothetical protein